IRPAQSAFWSGYAWLGGERFVVTHSSGDIGGRAAAWFVEADTGKIIPLHRFDCAAIEQIDSFADGGFVVLAIFRREFEQEENVYAFDAQGRRAWTLPKHSGYARDNRPGALCSPTDIAV